MRKEMQLEYADYKHMNRPRAQHEAVVTGMPCAKKVKRMRKSDQMFYASIIESMFDNYNLAWGENNELIMIAEIVLVRASGRDKCGMAVAAATSWLSWMKYCTNRW